MIGWQFALIDLQFSVISLQFAVISLQFAVIDLQFASIILQFAVKWSVTLFITIQVQNVVKNLSGHYYIHFKTEINDCYESQIVCKYVEKNAKDKSKFGWKNSDYRWRD